MPIPLKDTPNEADLERSGNINALRRERWRLWENEKSNVKADFNIYSLVQTEVNLRENIQREMALEHKLAACQKELATNPSLNLVTRVRDLDAEISKLNENYCRLEQRWSSARASFPEGPLTRGIELWRSHPRWYMHREL
ncbi:hypothetical protein N7517_006639 [Penicillium concentricum]|uniref:Uncharacterized protein n=1 Tax=Penicillium concentricum TaxID=293559 RepID=A0A9W9VA70_9EURO|nr:uncharacterized protein N7517_006639 [Penicillium concentricum]KAJ5374633.1 hypothetical protein N7517_006639 [Penicillium concentricum]